LTLPSSNPVDDPIIAIVGRPNVGKSTLFNRIVGSRRAIVGDEPSITRDRLYGEAEWRGCRLRIVDTGGIMPEEKDFIPSEIFRQAKVALKEAAAVIMVVDARTELASSDLELARLLIKSGKPLFLAVNKMDTDKQMNFIVWEFANCSRFPPSTAADWTTCWTPSSKYFHPQTYWPQRSRRAQRKKSKKNPQSNPQRPKLPSSAIPT
jgi:small GTP-binding protein